jgi:uncharacterized membrane protein
VGVYSATVSATSGSVKQQKVLSITVSPAPTFTLAASATSVSVAAGASKGLTLTTKPNSTFNAAITFTATGLPSGLTAQFSPSNVVAAPGSKATTVTFSAASSLAPNAYSVTVTAVGGDITQKQSLTVNVPGFSLTADATSVTVTSSAKGTVKFTTAALGGFNSAVALSVLGLPPGITASFSPQTVSSPGNGVSTLTLTKGTSAKTANSSLTVEATGMPVTKTKELTLTVK